MALIHSGKGKQATAETTILYEKVSINHKRNPKGKLDYGPSAGEGRFRTYVDYLQLCHALHALQAALSNDCEGAKKHIENARKLQKNLSPETKVLVAKIARQVNLDID